MSAHFGALTTDFDTCDGDHNDDADSSVSHKFDSLLCNTSSMSYCCCVWERLKRSVHETVFVIWAALKRKEQGRNQPLRLLVCDNCCTCIAVVRPIIYAVKFADNRARIYCSRPLVSMLMPQPLPVRQHSSNDSPKAVGPAKVLHTTAGNGKRGMQPARYVSAVKPQAAAVQAAASPTEFVLPAEVRFKQMPTAGAHSPSAPDARFKRDTADSRLKRENSNVDGQLKRDNSNVDGKARLKRDNSAIGAADSDAYRSGGSAGHHRVLPVADLHHDSSATAPLSPRSSPASPRTTPQFKRIASTAHDTDDSAAAAPVSPRAAHRTGREARVLPHGISRGPSMADSVGAEALHSLGGSVNSGAHAPAAAALAAAGAASTAASASAAAAAVVPVSQRAALHAQQRLLQRQQR
jgi:hypothetical protein